MATTARRRPRGGTITGRLSVLLAAETDVEADVLRSAPLLRRVGRGAGQVDVGRLPQCGPVPSIISHTRAELAVGRASDRRNAQCCSALFANAAFLPTLRDGGVRFAAVDLPEANDLMVGIMALVAQQEREAISWRTKEALSVARSRGVKLGNPIGANALRRAGKGALALRAAVVAIADRHAHDLAPVVADIRAGGTTSLRAMAAELNTRGMLTQRGGRWHVSTVMNLLDRLDLRETEHAKHGCREVGS